MTRATLLDLATIDRNDLDLSPLFELIPEWDIHQQTRPDQLDDRLRDVEIVLVNKVVIDEATLRRHPRLKLICVLATGTDNIHTTAATELGIKVRNVRAYGTRSVTQHVFMLLLSLARHQRDYLQAVADGAWSHSDSFCLLDYPIEEISGQTLGIVGFGELGRAVARMGEAFGMRIMVAERKGHPTRDGREPFERVITEADVLSLHCPLTDETKQIIDRDTLKQMKSTAWLINTARGGLIDELALADALDNGEIAAAAVDVLSQEPPPADHPLLVPKRPNLLVTPHIAWAARSARQRVIELTAENIRHFLTQ